MTPDATMPLWLAVPALVVTWSAWIVVKITERRRRHHG